MFLICTGFPPKKCMFGYLTECVGRNVEKLIYCYQLCAYSAKLRFIISLHYTLVTEYSVLVISPDLTCLVSATLHQF